MGSIPQVVEVRVQQPFVVEVTFSDDVTRRIDLGGELWGPMFEPLKDPEFFARVTVDPVARTLVWPNGADLAPEFLYAAGEVLVKPARPN